MHRQVFLNNISKYIHWKLIIKEMSNLKENIQLLRIKYQWDKFISNPIDNENINILQEMNNKSVNPPDVTLSVSDQEKDSPAGTVTTRKKSKKIILLDDEDEDIFNRFVTSPRHQSIGSKVSIEECHKTSHEIVESSNNDGNITTIVTKTNSKSLDDLFTSLANINLSDDSSNDKLNDSEISEYDEDWDSFIDDEDDYEFSDVEELSDNDLESEIEEVVEVTKSTFKYFKANRIQITEKIFTQINQTAFQSRFPTNFEIKWSNRLLTTAGRAILRRKASSREAFIELSMKVCDNEDRLRHTLVHELCHAAAWLFDGTSKPPHGQAFKKWANHASKYIPDIKVKTCHNFEIYKPHKWQCNNDDCMKQLQRHTKSIRKDAVCQRCACGTFTYIGSFDRDGTPKKQKDISVFSLFVKENFKQVKKTLGDNVTHKDVMQEISRLYKSKAGKNANVALENM